MVYLCSFKEYKTQHLAGSGLQIQRINQMWLAQHGMVLSMIKSPSMGHTYQPAEASRLPLEIVRRQSRPIRPARAISR